MNLYYFYIFLYNPCQYLPNSKQTVFGIHASMFYAAFSGFNAGITFWHTTHTNTHTDTHSLTHIPTSSLSHTHACSPCPAACNIMYLRLINN